jgi:hypothetical protein
MTSTTALRGTSSTSSVAPTPTATPSPRPQQPSVKNWFDLQVGDCLVGLPQVDQGEVTVQVVDCSAPHKAEVYLRSPVEVDAAIADVADRKCAAAVTDYTGQSATGGPFVVSYLIDSNQDRTSDNPLPSTVICLLQATNGTPMTTSARR